MTSHTTTDRMTGRTTLTPELTETPELTDDNENTLQRVREALSETGYPELRQVRVSVHDECIILRGALCSYYQKQLAQETAIHVGGARELKNEIEVG